MPALQFDGGECRDPKSPAKLGRRLQLRLVAGQGSCGGGARGLVAELVDEAREEMRHVAGLGGAVEAVDYMKASLVESHRERWRRNGSSSVFPHDPLYWTGLRG